MSSQFYLHPYKTKIQGFNTEFSLHELRTKVENGKPLDLYEAQYVQYLKNQKLWK